MPFYLDNYYILLVLPAIAIALIAQANVKGTYNKYSRVLSSRGVSGAQAARQILDESGLRHIKVEHSDRGELSDHYDPRDSVIRLSNAVYGSTSVAAIGIAAHEAGHAIQHNEGYAPIEVRNAIVPVVNIGSTISFPLILLGYLLTIGTLVYIGIVLFSLATLFQLITLPVEFNASNRAIKILQNGTIVNKGELSQAKKVLTAAAMTYVTALIVSIANLIRIILIFGRRRK